MSKPELIDLLDNIFGGLYSKKELQSLLDKFGLALQDQLISDGQVKIPHVGKLYVNFEGNRKVKDFVNGKEFNMDINVLRIKPQAEMKKKMRDTK